MERTDAELLEGIAPGDREALEALARTGGQVVAAALIAVASSGLAARGQRFHDQIPS